MMTGCNFHYNQCLWGQIQNFAILVEYKETEYGPGSSVGIVTDHRLDGPGSNPGGYEIFRPSRPALVSTQSPVKWVSGLSRG